MTGKTLTRADLAEALVRKIGLPRNESQELVELVLNEISATLSRGENVKLSSFGSFGIRKKGERLGRNPKTGEVIPYLQLENRIEARITRPVYYALAELAVEGEADGRRCLGVRSDGRLFPLGYPGGES